MFSEVHLDADIHPPSRMQAIISKEFTICFARLA